MDWVDLCISLSIKFAAKKEGHIFYFFKQVRQPTWILPCMTKLLIFFPVVFDQHKE